MIDITDLGKVVRNKMIRRRILGYGSRFFYHQKTTESKVAVDVGFHTAFDRKLHPLCDPAVFLRGRRMIRDCSPHLSYLLQEDGQREGEMYSPTDDTIKPFFSDDPELYVLYPHTRIKNFRDKITERLQQFGFHQTEVSTSKGKIPMTEALDELIKLCEMYEKNGYLHVYAGSQFSKYL